MLIERTGIRHQIDESSVHQRDDQEEEGQRLDDLLLICGRFLNRTKLRPHCTRMDKGVLYEHLTEIERRADCEVADRLRMQRTGIHGTMMPVGFWQQGE